MQTLHSHSTQNSLCKSPYRYSGQPIYALHEIIDESHDLILQVNSKKMPATEYVTGFSDLDYVCSVLQPGSLTVLASRPSMGKSTLALNIIQNLSVKNTIPTAIFSLEISKEQLAMRMLSSAA